MIINGAQGRKSIDRPGACLHELCSAFHQLDITNTIDTSGGEDVMLFGSNFGAKNTPVVNFIRAYAFVIRTGPL